VLGQIVEDPKQQPYPVPYLFDHPMLKSQQRIVLRNCGIIDPENIMHYIANDGYLGLMKAFENGPVWVIEQIKLSELRGRGGAGFPTAMKWEICRAMRGDEKTIICNADEGDPGAFMNRSLIEGDPHAVLEGLLCAGFAIGARHGIIYIRAEYPLAVQRLKKAVEQMKEYGFLGENIQGSGFHFDISIKEGAGAFVCGEETALIASIEGKRGMPRSKPPYPAEAGLWGKPTVINNTETLGTVPHILRNGGEWYHSFGIEKNRGSKTFSLAGKIQHTGLIEVPLGTTLREVIFDIGGGTKKPFKAVQTGGPSGGCIPSEHLDIPLSYEALASVGSIMGSGGLVVMDSDSCAVDVARYFLRFTQKESCGKCVTCRIGTLQMVNLLDKIAMGYGTLEDLDLLEELSQTVSKGSLCNLGATAPNPVKTTLKYFREEYLEHIEQKFCRAGVCAGLFAYEIDADKCNGCHLCVKSCPSNAILGERRQPHQIDQEKCIQCRACYFACHFEAINIIPHPSHV
jgi:NADH:ubiquinone oxidoreductase subunit F (NADH-binding)